MYEFPGEQREKDWMGNDFLGILVLIIRQLQKNIF